MDVLGCRTPEMVVEIWIYLLAYNLLRVLMTQAACRARTTPRQLSFKHTVQLWCAWRRRDHAIDEEGVERLLELIGTKRVGRRAGRVESRAVKRRPKCFKRPWAPRQVALTDPSRWRAGLVGDRPLNWSGDRIRLGDRSWERNSTSASHG